MTVEGSVPASIPDYLNKDFFRKSLENGLHKTDIKIVDLSMTMATNAGDNYTSSIYRVKVTYKEAGSDDKIVSLIVKSMPVDGDRAILEEMNVFSIERDLYFDIVPQIENVLKNIRIAPMCYYATADPIRTIVFEDMRESGFIIADRQAGLDELQCSLVLQKIAKFHAVSMDLMKRDKTIPEKFHAGFITEAAAATEVFQSFFRLNLKKGAELVSKMPGYEHFAVTLMKLYDNFVTTIVQSIESDPNDLKVLNHADLWVNNIMFKYNEITRKPIDMILVDFQASFVNSPAIDLNYFFTSSAQLDILKRKTELITKYYYPSFRQTLKDIDYKPIPTLDTILLEVRKRELYSVFILFGVLPLISMDKEESKTNHFNIFSDKDLAEKKRTVGMSSKRFVDTMQFCLKYFEKLNTFDEAFSKIK